MKCPECDGTGRIALFVSVQKCPACKGTGHVADPVEEVASTDPSGGDILTITGSENVGNIVLSETYEFVSSDLVSLGCTTSKSAALQVQSDASSPICCIFTGNTAPNKKGVDASMGSIFMCDDRTGSLWVKTGPGSNDWTELSTGSGTANADPYRDHRYTWGDNETFDRPQVVAHVAEVLDKYCELERQVRAREIEMDSFHEMTQELPIYDVQIPVVAPMSSAVVADMMALIEQEGLKVIGFVSSCRDYADVRKWDASTIGCQWDGSNFNYFGVPMWQSSEVPPGFFAAVDENKKIVLSRVTR